jgi:hypothetical protein
VVMDRERAEIEYTDEWWFKRLFAAFHQGEKRRDGQTRSRVEWCDYLWNWYLGTPDLPQHAHSWQAQVTLDVLNMGRANFAKLAVDSKLNRLKLEAFRPIEVDDDSDDDETPAQRQARRIMARHKAAFDEALLYASVMGDGYIWVGQPDANGIPTVTAEDPRECVTINDPVDRDRTVAALKMYRDELTGYDYAIVAIGEPYTPTPEEAGVDEPAPIGERIRIARRKSSGTSMTNKFMHDAWDWYDAKGSAELPIQGRGVMVHRVHAPQGLGDFEPHLDLLARINNMIVDRLWISKFQVFRQRVLIDKGDPNEVDPIPAGDEDDEDVESTGDASGKEKDYSDLLEADPGAVWRLPRGYEIWESTPTDLTPALLAVRDDIKEFAGVTFTPLYVFTPDAVQGSAEGAGLAREGQVYKAEAWQTVAARPFLNAAGDMLAVAGTPIDDIQLKWMPAERYSLIQKAQAAQLAQAAGVPWEGRMEDFMQLPPETISRYKTMRRADALLNGGVLEQPVPVAAPAAPAAAPPAPVDEAEAYAAQQRAAASQQQPPRRSSATPPAPTPAPAGV